MTRPTERRRRRLRVTRRGWVVLGVVAAAALTGAAWTARDVASSGSFADASGVSRSPSPTPEPASPTPTPEPTPLPGPATTRDVSDALRLVRSEPDEDLTHVAAEAFFEDAPLAVVVDGSEESLDLGAWLALRFQVPLLEAGPATPAVLRRLGTETVLAVGDIADLPVADVREIVPRSASRSWSEPTSGSEAAQSVQEASWGIHRLRAFLDGAPPAGWADLSSVGSTGVRWGASEGAVTVVIRRGDDAAVAAAATALAAGHEVVPIAAPDPREDPRAAEELAGADLERLILLGSDGAWDDADEGSFGWQLAVAQRGLELPGGGQLIFPHRRFVALYGTPGSGALGVLGEQPLDAAIDRAKEQALAYAPLSDVPVIPTFEIIATVASGSAGADGDYSTERAVEDLEPWVEAARAEGIYVVLDLQPGRTDFLTQAKRYRSLLVQPHVGLALDPEWRLAPNQRHLVQIGGVDAAEVNQVSEWLAGLVREHRLPQKLLVIHQFKLSMIRDRSALETTPELATLIQMDGQGGQPVKLDTWRAILRDAPAGVWWGWKNFHDEDTPTRSPEDTMSLDPQPVFISYQ